MLLKTRLQRFQLDFLSSHGVLSLDEFWRLDIILSGSLLKLFDSTLHIGLSNEATLFTQLQYICVNPLELLVGQIWCTVHTPMVGVIVSAYLVDIVQFYIGSTTYSGITTLPRDSFILLKEAKIYSCRHQEINASSMPLRSVHTPPPSLISCCF